MRRVMYEVWQSRGNGLEAGPRFRVLEDAVRHATVNRDQASFAIRLPKGSWYQWPSVDGQILPRRHVRSRQLGGELQS